MNIYRKRQIISGVGLLILTLAIIGVSGEWKGFADYFKRWQTYADHDLGLKKTPIEGDILAKLEELPVKGRAPKTGYKREHFGNGWAKNGACTTRNLILKRDLIEAKVDTNCKVLSGKLNDPYTDQQIEFQYGAATSSLVQIDHVVAVSDAWQKGAQNITPEERVAFYNDPVNLLAVSGSANQAKGDSDAASWLPANKSFRCEYVKRQVEVKHKYYLWVTAAEKAAIVRELERC